MFTGIVETTAEVKIIEKKGTNISFGLQSDIASELKVDQSVNHNGVCLTVEAVEGNIYKVTAILETLTKTNLKDWVVGSKVNLERCLPSNGRFDGHIVQGHVDQTGRLINMTNLDGSWQLDIEYDTEMGNITVEKGSVCVNGVSLTVFNSEKGKFSVALIPYTWEHTNLSTLKPGDIVNLEFDIIGKYVARLIQPFQ